MTKILKLVIANLRNGKGHAVGLLLFAMIAALLLNIGLVMFFDFIPFFDERAEELNAPHVTFIQSEDITTEKQFEYLSTHPLVVETEKQEILSALGDYYMNGSKSTGVIILASANRIQNMNPLSTVGKSLPLTDSSIYIPLVMKSASGYQLGDEYKLILDGHELTYTVAGFTEEIMYGALTNTLYRYYITEKAFMALYDEAPELHCTLQSVRLSDNSRDIEVERDYTREFFYSQDTENASSLYIHSLSLDNARTSRTMMPLVIAMLVIAFSIILLAVSLVVIRFRIITSIEEGMTNIGALKAIGYTNRQIIASIILQFSGIALAGSLVGAAITQVILPLLNVMLESQMALMWSPDFDLAAFCLTVVFVLSCVAAVAFLVARRIRKLPPLVALRSGLKSHIFRKNRFPLDSSRSPLNILLASKQIVQNLRQSVMIALIIALVSFAAVAASSIYYNLGVDTDAFADIVAGEKPDAGLLLIDQNNTQGVLERLSDYPEVRKAFEYQNVTLLADESAVDTYIVEDFSQLEGNMLYSGRYPKHNNEVAIGGNTSKLLGKTTGDKITVDQGDIQKEFYVTGIIQMMSSQGVNMVMTYDGLLSVQPDYLFNQIYIYLQPGTDVPIFLDKVLADEGDIFTTRLNMQELVDAQLGSIGDVFVSVTIVILLVTALVIVLVLYMVIKSTILRRSRDLGVQKAIGYTTRQLMNQIALQFTPIVLFGVLTGGLGAFFGFNPLFSALTRSMGIIKTNLPMPVLWTLLICLALVLLAYGVSLLVSRRIRKLSPYTLINE